MKRKIAILGKSRKNRGLCVGGIDVSTNEWVRIKCEKLNMINNGHLTTPNGYICDILDVVEIDFLDKETDLYFQPENKFINPFVPIKYLYTTTWAEIISKGIDTKDENGHILDISDRFISETELKQLNNPFSLQLIKVDNMLVFRDFIYPDKVKASFTYQGYRKEFFPVTDLAYHNLTENGTITIDSAYLIISRGEGFSPNRTLKNHYSIVAQIVDTSKVDKVA